MRTPSTPKNNERWPLGLMVVCGYEQHSLADQLEVVVRLGASHIEFYPRWVTAPDPKCVGNEVRDAGLEVWSAHGPWGSETWSDCRVDLASPDPAVRRKSVGEVLRSVEWLAAAGGKCLVVHPGVLSASAEFERRRVALIDSLQALAPFAAKLGIWLCVENLPPGSFPGSFTTDNAQVIRHIGASHIGLCLDTGHANIIADVGSEIRAAAGLLRTTHVHDNDGKRDSHLLPGLGTIQWPEFSSALDEIQYIGAIMLECPRFLRENPHLINDALTDRLARMCCKPSRSVHRS